MQANRLILIEFGIWILWIASTAFCVGALYRDAHPVIQILVLVLGGMSCLLLAVLAGIRYHDLRGGEAQAGSPLKRSQGAAHG
jgi:hypothetical protein